LPFRGLQSFPYVQKEAIITEEINPLVNTSAARSNHELVRMLAVFNPEQPQLLYGCPMSDPNDCSGQLIGW